MTTASDIHRWVERNVKKLSVYPPKFNDNNFGMFAGAYRYLYSMTPQGSLVNSRVSSYDMPSIVGMEIEVLEYGIQSNDDGDIDGVIVAEMPSLHVGRESEVRHVGEDPYNPIATLFASASNVAFKAKSGYDKVIMWLTFDSICTVEKCIREDYVISNSYAESHLDRSESDEKEECHVEFVSPAVRFGTSVPDLRGVLFSPFMDMVDDAGCDIDEFCTAPLKGIVYHNANGDTVGCSVCCDGSCIGFDAKALGRCVEGSIGFTVRGYDVGVVDISLDYNVRYREKEEKDDFLPF